MTIPESPSPKTARSGVVLGLLVAVFALLQCWDYSRAYPGDDLLIYWAAGRQLTETEDLYSAEGWQQVEDAISAQTGEAGDQRSGAVRPAWPKLSGTPFLYAVFRAASTGDYSHDQFWFRLFQLIATGLGIYVWARVFGHGPTLALLAVVLFTVGFEPLRSSLRAGNLGQLQLLLLALCAVIPRRRNGGLGEVAVGCMLGLAVMFKPNLAACALMFLVVRVVDQRWRALTHSVGGLALGSGCAALFTSVVAGSHATWPHWLALLGEFLDSPPTIAQGNYSLAGMLAPWLGDATSPVLLLGGVCACALLLGWRARIAPGADPRRCDALALALGCVITLLSAPVAWLHYYQLAVPVALFCLYARRHRNGGADGPAWMGLVGAAVVMLSLRPILLLGDPGGPTAYAALTIGGTWLLGLAAFVAVIRAPALAGDDESRPDLPLFTRLGEWLALPWRPGLLLLLVGGLVYASALDGGFHLDDTYRVVENPAIRQVSLSQDLSDPGTSSSNPRIVQFRPLMPWSFSLNYAAHGLSTFGYHLVNLAFHLISAWLLFALACELLLHWSGRRLRERRARLWALAAALLFCVHPVSGLVVNYISARDLVMMQCFSLAALLTYVRMRRLGESPRRWALVLVCFGAALLSKTNAAVFPVIVLLFEVVLARRSFRDRRLWTGVAAPAVLVAAFVGYGVFVLGFVESATAQGPESPLVYGLTQLRVHLTHYLANWIWPWKLGAAPAVNVAYSLTSLSVWSGLLLIVASLAAAFAWRRRQPLLTFSILSYWVMLAPTSSVLPLHHFVAHYRPYPGSPFLLIGVVFAAGTLLHRRARLAVATTVISACALASLAQNAVWKTEQSLWKHSVAVGGDHIAQLNYAMSIEDRTDPRIRQHLEQALALYPEYVFAHINLAIHRIRVGDVEAGLTALRSAETRYPGWPEVPFWLGTMLSRQARHDEAAQAFARAVQIDPQQLSLQYAAAREHQVAGLVAESLPYLDVCERLQSGYKDIDFLRGFALQDAGLDEQAIASYRKHLAADPDHGQSHFNLGYALMKTDRSGEAIPHFLRVLELTPDSRAAALHLAHCRTAVAEGEEREPPVGASSNDASAPDGAAPRRPAVPAGSMRWQAPAPSDELSEALSDDLARLAEIGYVTGVTVAGEAAGVSRYDPDAASPGLNLYLSGDAPAAYLMTMEGDVVHQWRLSFDEAFPDADPSLLGLDGTQYWRRAHLFENGDLLVIFDYLGLVRIDRDSQLLWAIPLAAHHDLFVTDERIHVLSESVGVVAAVREESPVREDFITTLDHRGNVLGQLSILQAFLHTPFAQVLDALPAHDDIFHTNTIQVLDGSHAGRSEVFAAGNVLVSLRNLNRIAIVDPEQQAVVWSMAGGWQEQHDPLLLENGNMLIFDNRTGGAPSRIVEFDPLGQSVAWTFDGTAEQSFFSERMGTVQRLPNGNTLIAESFVGRALEVTADQRIVWQFDNPARTGDHTPLVAILPDIVRVDPTYTSSWLNL